MADAGVPVLIDYKPAIAHNKIILIDGVLIITGSFNFTESAEKRNAENCVFLRNEPALFAKYREYFESRRRESRAFNAK